MRNRGGRAGWSGSSSRCCGGGVDRGPRAVGSGGVASAVGGRGGVAAAGRSTWPRRCRMPRSCGWRRSSRSTSRTAPRSSATGGWGTWRWTRLPSSRGCWRCSSVHAERRVAAAVALAADGPEGTATESGLGGLHEAMGAGRLDEYRAGVVAQELEAAPPQVRATVVAVLQGHFELEDAAHLRRRCRRALARISPDLLRQRALRARASCGLRRWVEEPGVDRWEGTFPSEDAAKAWAAIDALARRYVADGVCPGIEGARGKALTDLVAGNATIDTVLTLTVPAAAIPGTAVELEDAIRPARPADAVADDVATQQDAEATGRSRGAGDDLVEVTGPAGNQPVLVSRAWVAELAARRRPPPIRRSAACRWRPATRSPVRWSTRTAWRGPRLGWTALAEEGLDESQNGVSPVTADAYRPSARLARLVRLRDRRCRFPGCTVAAVFCDLDHVRPWPVGPTDRHQPGLPVPTPPPRQATTRLARLARHRRHRRLDRPHRQGSHHPPRRRPHQHRADRCPAAAGRAGRRGSHPHRPARRTAQRPRVPSRAPRGSGTGSGSGSGSPRGRAGAHHDRRGGLGRRHRVELMPSPHQCWSTPTGTGRTGEPEAPGGTATTTLHRSDRGPSRL